MKRALALVSDIISATNKRINSAPKMRPSANTVPGNPALVGNVSRSFAGTGSSSGSPSFRRRNGPENDPSVEDNSFVEPSRPLGTSETDRTSLPRIVNQENSTYSHSESAGTGEPSSALMPGVEPRRCPFIRLSKLEERIFHVLLSVVNDLQLGLTLRVAGGWVRDKLLYNANVHASTTCAKSTVTHAHPYDMDASNPKFPQTSTLQDDPTPAAFNKNGERNDFESNPAQVATEADADHESASVDIDIALDNMMGEQFAQHVNSWLVSNNHPPASYGVIASNPDQSKHLATARMKVLGVWVDLVNLRTETYATSRIPEVQIGTPFEDAMRRDLTINALFYNINTRKVEDFTRNGIDDLRARIIRTPLLPLTTLLDDPLRALRAVRFASRLNFIFDEELYRACSDPQVHEALGAKVSRERISAEIDMIMSSASPIHAIGLMTELSLFPVVFRLPPDVEYVGDARPPPDFPYAALGCLINLERLCQHWRLESPTIATAVDLTAESKKSSVQCPTIAALSSRIARYAALLAPIANVSVMCSDSPKGRRRQIPLAQFILRSELRMSTKDVTSVLTVHSSSLEFRTLVHLGSIRGCDPPFDALESRDDVPERLAIARILQSCGSLWRTALQIALVTEFSPAVAAETYIRGIEAAPQPFSAECKVFIDAYSAFEKSVDSMELEGVWELKPLVDGHRLSSILPKLPKGPMYRKVMEAQIEYMIMHPDVTTNGVVEWIETMYKQYT